MKKSAPHSSPACCALSPAFSSPACKATQEYEFVLKQGEVDIWKCQSATGIDQQFADGLFGIKSPLAISLTSKSSFVSTFKCNNRPETWRLRMNEDYDSRGVMKGILSDGKVSIAIQGSRKLAGSPFPISTHSGFEFMMKEQVIGSVQVINKGAVWIIPSLEERLNAPLAVASAALLLYQDIKE